MVSILLIITHKKFKNLNVIYHYIFKCHLTWYFYLQQLYLNEKIYILNVTVLTLVTYKTSSSNLIYEHIKKWYKNINNNLITKFNNKLIKNSKI